MIKYVRIPGGEKNSKSGKRWSLDELRIVRDAFLSLPESVGVHESNPVVHEVSKKLGRTVRSVEAQMHMFKYLRKGGNHAWGHMNKRCLTVWKEYLEKL